MYNDKENERFSSISSLTWLGVQIQSDTALRAILPQYEEQKAKIMQTITFYILFNFWKLWIKLSCDNKYYLLLHQGYFFYEFLNLYEH